MCKHRNGFLIEHMEATHERQIIDGVMENEGNNEVGNIEGYSFICIECKKRIKYKKQKWIKKYIDRLCDDIPVDTSRGF